MDIEEVIPIENLLAPKIEGNEWKIVQERYSEFTNIRNQAQGCKVAVVIDWLAILFMDNDMRVPIAKGETDVVAINDTITFKNFGKGTKDYKTTWHVLYHGEHYATLLAEGRNGKFVRKGLVRVEFKNHLLYSSSLWPFYDALVMACRLQYVNISRVDIAIDGANYLLNFLNQYIKQSSKDKLVELKGKKQRFSSNILDRRSMLYQNFRIGSSRKLITIYNKSLDIVNTGKHYIQEYWKANGIVQELMPLQALAKALQEVPTEERTYIEGYYNLYRFEMRITGERIKQIKDFNLSMLKTSDWLVSIVKRLCDNFFEFVYYTNNDLSKCHSFTIMPYCNFEIQRIELLPKKDVGDLYKTKLSINKNIRQLYRNNLSCDDYSVRQMLVFDINNFELLPWFTRKFTEWDKEYEATQPNKIIVEEVRNFVHELIEQLELQKDID